MRLRPPCVALLCCFAVAPALVSAQETGVVRGRVTDAATGQPVPEVRITVTGLSLEVTSGANGEYLLPAVATGPHEVVARRVGFAAARQTVEVAAEQTAVADFTLRAVAVALDAGSPPSSANTWARSAAAARPCWARSPSSTWRNRRRSP